MVMVCRGSIWHMVVFLCILWISLGWTAEASRQRRGLLTETEHPIVDS
jgi:hypothetical protein